MPWESVGFACFAWQILKDMEKIWRQIEKSYQKLARISNHLTFLHWCRDQQLIPSGLVPRLPVNSRRARLVTEKVGHALVRERIQYNRWIKQRLQAHISERLKDFFNRITNEEDQRRIQNDLDKSFSHEFDVVKAHQVQKLNRLKDQKVTHKVHHPPVKAVVNISHYLLSASEESVLNESLNFTTTIRWVPYLDIITRVEEVALNIPQAQADELR